MSVLVRAPLAPATDETTARMIVAGQEREALGFLLAPLIIDAFLLAILLTQVYTFFRYQNDRKVTRAVVIVVLVISVCFSAYFTWLIQWFFVENFGKFAPLFQPKHMAIASFLDSFVPVIVQCFMSDRAYRLLNRAIWIPITVCVLCLTSLGANIAVTVLFFQLNTLLDAYTLRIPEVIRLTALMIADMIVTGCIVWGLVRSRTGWGHTDSIISRLVRMTLEAQIPPVIIAVMIMIAYLRFPRSLINATLRGMQSKLYAVGMMFSINAKVSLRLQTSEPPHTSNSQVFAMSHRRNPTEVHMVVETETCSERPYTSGHNLGKSESRATDQADEKNLESGYGSQAQLTRLDGGH